MPTATYGEFRVVLRRVGFREKTLPTGEILQVRVSHQQARDIPRPLFHQMLRQAQLTQTEFFTRLREA